MAGTRLVSVDRQVGDLKFPDYSMKQFGSSSLWQGVGRDSITLPLTIFTKHAKDAKNSKLYQEGIYELRIVSCIKKAFRESLSFIVSRIV